MSQNYLQYLYASTRVNGVKASAILIQSLFLFKTNVYQQPKILNEKIFIPLSDGSIACYDLVSKQELWMNTTFSKGLKPKLINSDLEIVVHADKLFVQLNDKLHVLQQGSGKAIRYIESFTDDLKSTCFYDDYICYTTFINNKVYAKALKLSSDETAWTYKIETAMVSVVSSGDVIVISNGTKELIGLNKYTGIELWKFNLSNLPGLNNRELHLASYPKVIKNSLIGSANNGAVCSINLKKGDLIWQTFIKANKMPDDISFDANETLYVSGMNEVYGIDLTSGEIKIKTGENLNEIFEKRMFFTGPVADNFLIITSRNSPKLACLNLITGKVERSINLKGSCKYVPFIAQNKLFVYDNKQNLYITG